MASPANNPSPLPRTPIGLLAHAPLLLLALVLVALYFGKPFLFPMAVALSLTFLLTPLVMQIQRLRVGRIPAVLLVLAMTATLVGGVGWIVGRQVIGVINDLPNYRENIQQKLYSLHAPTAGPLSRTVRSIREIGAEIANTTESPGDTATEAPHTRRERALARLSEDKQPVPVRVVAPAQTAAQYFSQYARPVLEPLAILALIVIFSFYMLVKREDLRNRLLLLAGKGQLNLMSQAMNEAAARISRYLITNVLVNAGYGVIFGVALYLLHVPNATLWGALMAILRMIPYVGTMIAGFSTVAFTLAVFDNWWHPLWVLLLFGGLEFVIANFIEPHIYGKRTGISSFALVIMAIVWTLVWGWPGLIVSTPMTVCLIVMGRHIPQMSFLYILMGEEAELSPEAQFYERLLAMDQSGAHAIADSFLEGKTLLDLYDGMVLPAILLSERDRHKGELDNIHSAWLYQSTTELVAELTDYAPPAAPGGEAESGAEPQEQTSTAITKAENAEAEAVPEHTSPVVCVPAEDPADEIAATMLAQLLEKNGHSTMLLSRAALTEEILERLGEESNTILCISAVPPFAFAQARKMTQSLRKNVPRNPIVVGLWGSKDDVEKLRDRFGGARPTAIVTTLRDALQRVKEIDNPAREQTQPAPVPVAAVG
jgi:predicted PurR-regulated permease PerM